MDVNAVNAAADVAFAQWAITDAPGYEGCGAFYHYGLSGSAPALAKLTYPTPGLTLSVHCISINQCISFRVTNTAYAGGVIQFNLGLLPILSQNAITIPFVVDITPCRNAAFYLNVAPPELVIKRVASLNFKNEYLIQTTYSSNMYNSEPTYCPILRYTLLDSLGNVPTNTSVQLLEPLNPTRSRLSVFVDKGFVLSVRIKSETMSKNAFQTLSVKVCGNEVLSLASALPRVFTVG